MSKPPSDVDRDWIFWTHSEFKKIAPDSNKIAALLYITRKKEIEIIYRPTPIIDNGDHLLGIIGNMLDDGSIPAIVKVNGEDIGLCSTIQNFIDIPEIFRPEIALLADSVKDTEWENASNKIALVIVPTLAPLPFGTDIKSTILDDDFIDEMKNNSAEHGFWAKMMADAHEQYASDFDNSSVIKNLTTANVTSARHDPCRAATKGFRDAMLAISGPIADTSCPGNKHEHEQSIIKEFFP